MPRYLREVVGAITLHVYDTTKAELRRDFDAVPATIARSVGTALVTTVTSLRTEMRPDLERLALFMVLFRSQADQSRRSDAIDATLGVFLTALLVVAPFAVERAPTIADRWIMSCGFAVAAAAVIAALFFVSGREPGPGLAAKLALDLRYPDRGTYEDVVATTNRAAADPFFRPSQTEEAARGAAGDLAQLFMQDRASLRLKRHLTYAALIACLALSLFAGIRDVLYFSAENTHVASNSSSAVSSGLRTGGENPDGR